MLTYNIENCYEKINKIRYFIIKYIVFNIYNFMILVGCLKIALSKCLGYGIIFGSVLGMYAKFVNDFSFINLTYFLYYKLYLKDRIYNKNP